MEQMGLGRLACVSILLFILVGTFGNVEAQVVLSGTVSDETTSEGLIGASVAIGKTGTVTDLDGKYSITLVPGVYDIAVSYVGYEPFTTEFNLSSNQTLDIVLKSSQLLQEIIVTADIARERETPVAFSNIPTLKLEEELAAQEIPMVLNSTPGAYATQSGGGDGDARITIRGFNQRNVAVMLNGIPVNDMENGWVYWSNWFGLDLVTKTMQVQRGLGASKLAIPSVGGTINILTKGIDAKQTLRLKQEFGNDGFLRSTVGFTSGRLKNGWGLSFAGSYKEGDGWVQGNFTKGFFYYGRIDKEIGNHTFSFTGFGAPQKHGQRSFKTHISEWDSQIAIENDVSESFATRPGITNRGLRYNDKLGLQNGEIVNTSINFYHKPQLSLRHSWSPANKLFVSNVAYLSIGNGGGSSVLGNFSRNEDLLFDMDTAQAYNESTGQFKPETNSENILQASINNHYWYGLLSTARYNFENDWSLSGGVDLRRYRGDHYRTVYDLLGGTFFIDKEGSNLLIDNSTNRLTEGDPFEYNNSGFVRWAGAFALAELKKPNYTVFLNASSSLIGYKWVDYFKPMVVDLADTSFTVTYDSPVEYLGTTYDVDHSAAKNQELGWIDIPGFTLKTGANYKLTEDMSVFVNLGYLSKAQRMRNVINSNRNRPAVPIAEYNQYENELVLAQELGFAYKSPKIAFNLNTYRTEWRNKPLDSFLSIPNPVDPEERLPINVSGIDALHMGVEFDVAFEITDKIKLEGLLSIGDWKWNSGSVVTLPDGSEFDFNAKGVPVGDAAQFQSGATLRVEPVNGLYFKPKWSFFDRNYANFNPTDLDASVEDANRIPWRLPAYSLFDFHMGYGFKIKDRRSRVRFNILNVLDAKYISDAQNNDSFLGIGTSSDANSAAVFFGQGRRWTTSFEISF